MRRLKKGCAVVLALALSMSFMTGCGDNNSKNSGDLKTTESEATSTDAANDAQNIEEYVDNYAKDVELGEYKGLEYEDTKKEVTDEDVQKKVDEFVESKATYTEDKESAAKNGDKVNIDFVGTVDGKEFDGGNTQGNGYDLVLGSGSFIDNFEDQIVGHKAGDKFTVKVTFPEDYGNDSLNGKAAEFETTLNYIKIDVPAEYNDKLVADNTDFSNTKDYEANIRKELETDNAQTALASAQNEVMVKAINNSTISNLSTDDIQANADKIISSLKTQAENNGIDYATYIYYYYGYDDEDSFAQYVYQVCEESQKEKMVVCAIAKAENLSVTDEETDEYLANYAKKNSVDEESIRSNLTDVEIKYNALAEKVMNLMMDSAKAVASTEDTEAEDTEAATETAE